MGTGFCVVVSPADAAAALAALTAAGEQPVVAGSATDRPGRYVSVPAAGLLGHGDKFFPGGIPSRHGRPWLCRVERG